MKCGDAAFIRAYLRCACVGLFVQCYWEWVWQNMQATRYMHNPEMWGLLEFTQAVNTTAPLCRNVEWPEPRAMRREGRPVG